MHMKSVVEQGFFANSNSYFVTSIIAICTRISSVLVVGRRLEKVQSRWLQADCSKPVKLCLAMHNPICNITSQHAGGYLSIGTGSHFWKSYFFEVNTTNVFDTVRHYCKIKTVATLLYKNLHCFMRQILIKFSSTLCVEIGYWKV